MTLRLGKWWMVFAAVGVLALAVGVFLIRAGLENADHWASVIGLFVSLAGVLSGVYSALQARQASVAGRSPEPASNITKNHIKGGTFAGPALLGRDMDRVNLTGMPGAPLSEDRPSGMPEPAAGDTSNRIDAGEFRGPVVMGRDMRGIDLGSPAGGQAGDDGTGKPAQ